MYVCSGGSRGGGGNEREREKERGRRERERGRGERERERERGGGGAVFIHSPVKCNKSLYIFTRCIALLVYQITFELLKQFLVYNNFICSKRQKG